MSGHAARLRAAIERERKRLPKSCPLRVTSAGQWAKTIDGNRRTFGSVLSVTRQEAEARYHAFVADLAAGRDPRPIDADRVTVGFVFNRYLERQAERAEAGEVERKTLATRIHRLRVVGEHLGERRPVDHLTPAVFGSARTSLLARHSPASAALLMSQARHAFAWAVEHRILDRAPHYGDEWRPPPMRERRLASRGKGFPGGRRHFTGEEVRRLLEAAPPLLRVSVLLAVSAGMLAADLARLRRDEVDFDAGWIDHTRHKTGIPRRAPVWPEVREAWEAWRAHHRRRGDRRAPGAEDLFVVTETGLAVARRGVEFAADGTPREKSTDALRIAFDKALRKSGVRPKARKVEIGPMPAEARGIGFSTLRRTCATFADGAGDRLAKARIMAHAADAAIDDSYVDRIADDRIIAVSNAVRRHVFPDAEPLTRA